MRGVAVSALLGGAVLASAVPAGAEPGETVVDRTLECRTHLTGGIFQIQARARAGVRTSSSTWRLLPFAGIGESDSGVSNALVWISAGRPSPTTLLDEGYFETQVREEGTLGISRGLCRSTRAKVALSTRGLDGGQIGQLGEVIDCETPRSVVVRVRASLDSGALRTRGDFLRATAPIGEAAIAVQTRSGKRIAYASVAASGRTRLFTARGCIPD